MMLQKDVPAGPHRFPACDIPKSRERAVENSKTISPMLKKKTFRYREKRPLWGGKGGEGKNTAGANWGWDLLNST